MMAFSPLGLVFVLCFAALPATNSLNAADYFTICHKSDADLDGCIAKSLNDMRPLLVKGSKDLKLNSIDPMIVPLVEVKQGGATTVNIESKFIDLKISGLSQYDITDVRSHLERNELELDVKIPYLYLEGKYKINGKILVLPISGEGEQSSNYTGVSGVMTLKFKPVKKGAETYINLEKLNFDIKVKSARINFGNLFGGNKQLGDAMNKFMSDNWEVVSAELKPVIDSALGSVLEGVAARVVSRFPAKQIFPE